MHKSGLSYTDRSNPTLAGLDFGPAGLRITAQCCLLVEPGDWRILPVVNDLEINRSQFSSSHGVVTVLKTQREEDHSRTDSRTCLWQEG